MYRRRFLSTLIVTLILVSNLGFGLWDGRAGVSKVRAQATLGRCAYYVYVPLALRNSDGSSSGTGTPTGFTPPNVDFNGDGYADVAIAVPREDVFHNGADRTDAGAVNILYGTGNGLAAAGNQIFTQKDVNGLNPPVPEGQDLFGEALAAADFDGNGCTDLAVGAPGEGIGGNDDAGAVYVFYGTPVSDGLETGTARAWNQGTFGLQDSIEAFDSFGQALGAGDFDSDGYGDLVIGVPFEEINGKNAAGAFHVLYGSSLGLTADDSQFFDQSDAGVSEDPEAADLFGSAFAAGDFDDDGYQDLAVGAPEEDYEDEDGNASDAGAVRVLFGSSTGLTNTVSARFASSIQNARYGSSLAAGDFDADGKADLAMGAPNYSTPFTNTGEVTVWYGPFGLQGDIEEYENTGAAEDDYFGASLAAGDFDADGAADLVIGVPGDSSIASGGGAAWLLYGVVGSGLPSSWDFIVTQGDLSGDGVEASDDFGRALTAGDYNGDRSADLIISVPDESLEDVGVHQAGGVHEVYGGEGSGLTLTGNTFWTQASTDDGIDVKGAVEANDFFGQSLR